MILPNEWNDECKQRWQDKIKRLEILYHYKMETPLYEDRERSADMTLARTLARFLSQYGEQLRRKYTFIVDYRNDVYSYLAYRIVRNAASAINSDIDIRLLGELKLDEEKKFFADVPTIGWRKAKKHKKAVIITAFNPIYNVKCAENFSNIFIEVFNPLEYVSPTDLATIQDYYLEKDSSLYVEGLGKNGIEKWYEFYEKPFVNECPTELTDTPPCVIFILSGTEEDFPAYDAIRASVKEGNTHLYIIPEEKIKFVVNCLSPYVPSAYIPNDLNIITEDTMDKLRDANRDLEVVSFYKLYMEAKENENSNS